MRGQGHGQLVAQTTHYCIASKLQLGLGIICLRRSVSRKAEAVNHAEIGDARDKKEKESKTPNVVRDLGITKHYASQHFPNKVKEIMA